MTVFYFHWLIGASDVDKLNEYTKELVIALDNHLILKLKKL